MLNDSESNAAELIKFLERRVTRLESEREPDGSVNQIRNVSETELSSDATTSSVDTAPGWTWGQSTWGFDSW